MSKAADQNTIPGFAIAGEDKKWKWASAKIEGSNIVVWNDAIAAPVASGLPAVPFRTDDWPGVTVNSK